MTIVAQLQKGFSGLSLKQNETLLYGGLTALVAYVAVCNLFVPETSAFYVSTYTVTILAKYLCYAMLALSLDLIWGYGGILSLGQGAFFGLGGYAMGMYLMREIGDRGVYGNPLLPDFMVFLNWQELPWFWQPFDHFGFTLLAVLLVPGLLAFVFAWFAFRSRVVGVYLSIMTQALTYALMLAFFRNEMGFGGNNGLTDFKDILGYSLQSDTTRIVLFILTAVLLMLVYALCQWIVTSRFGRVVTAVRDGENRVRFLGYKAELFKVALFVLSAMIAGVAGALYVPQVGIINPGEFSPLSSIEVVIWVAVGGRGTLWGAIIGALVVNYAKTRFTAIAPESWLFALGAMFVLVTLLLPKGIAGALPVLQARVQRWLQPKATAEGVQS